MKSGKKCTKIKDFYTQVDEISGESGYRGTVIEKAIRKRNDIYIELQGKFWIFLVDITVSQWFDNGKSKPPLVAYIMDKINQRVVSKAYIERN